MLVAVPTVHRLWGKSCLHPYSQSYELTNTFQPHMKCEGVHRTNLSFHQFIWKISLQDSAATPHQTGSSCLDLHSSSSRLKGGVLGALGDHRHPQQHHPRQVPYVRAAQPAAPLLLLGKFQLGFPLHCLIQA